MSDFEALLRSYREQGQSEGEGRFVWDLERALRILPSAQLADKSHYILRVVAAAVAGGADEFHFKPLKNGCRLSWNGCPLTASDMHALLPSVIGGEPRLSELAVAVGAACRLYPELELQGAEATLTMTNGRVEVRSEAGAGGASLILRGPGWSKWLRKLRGASELQLIAQRCIHAPLRFVVPAGDAVAAPEIEVPVIVFGSAAAQPEVEVLYQVETTPATASATSL